MSALSHRSHQAVLGALVAALMMVALPSAGAQSGRAHGVPAAPVNAPGTDVAAPDQQVKRPVVNARGTDVAAPDQQGPPSLAAPADAIGAIDGSDDSGLTLPVLTVVALGLAGAAFASRHAMSRRRGRAAV